MPDPFQLSFDVSEESIYSVSRLAASIREVVETGFDDIRVEGELSNFKQHRSGHCYFSLKDGEAQVRCVMWRPFTKYVFFEPKDGMLVRVRGNVSLYEARGDLQLVARSMQMAGEGALQKAFEVLKQRLATDGLFDADRKRPLPSFPSTIGIVTSGNGAALHDILTVLERRFPALEVIVFPVAVQGFGAAEEIASAIADLNRMSEMGSQEIDILIVGRGGGSIEDLWCFNEEVVARAIARSSIPIISAVGHETDYTIADFVADVRAATPSMAAEIAVPDQTELRMWLKAVGDSIHGCVERHIERRRNGVTTMLRSRAFTRPADRIRQHAQRLDELLTRLIRGARRSLERHRRHVDGYQRQLNLLNPASPLKRGYTKVERRGIPLSSAADVHPNDVLDIIFHDGAVKTKVEAKEMRSTQE
ncbi:MAG: exodeoxyribonuclease VII large subunit [Rhodothermales bacterium]